MLRAVFGVRGQEASINDKWPACRGAMGGTRAARPRFARSARTSAIVWRTFTAVGYAGAGEWQGLRRGNNLRAVRVGAGRREWYAPLHAGCGFSQFAPLDWGAAGVLMVALITGWRLFGRVDQVP